jgi:hypothetical protein
MKNLNFSILKRKSFLLLTKYEVTNLLIKLWTLIIREDGGVVVFLVATVITTLAFKFFIVDKKKEINRIEVNK